MAVTADQLQTKLFKAAKNGNQEQIAPLIAEGTQVGHVNERGYTTLIKEAQYGQLECVRVIIASHALVNLGDGDRVWEANRPISEKILFGKKFD